MKGRYINTKTLLACLSTARIVKKDIHTQLEETIAEHKRIMEQWWSLFLSKSPVIMKDIHTQLEETIAERRRIMQVWKKLSLLKQDDDFAMSDKQAA